jgi:hypothetical protein
MFVDNGLKKVDFLSTLELAVISDNKFNLIEDFHVAISGKLLTIPKGFTTDLASVPRIPIAYLAVGARGHKAAVVHDYLYLNKLFPRSHCDAVFREGLKECGLSWWEVYTMYLGVRIGGGFCYGS